MQVKRDLYLVSVQADPRGSRSYIPRKGGANVSGIIFGTNPVPSAIIGRCNLQFQLGRMVRRVAVALPALNERARIVACVSSLLSQSEPDFALSVHVFANNCTDGTADILRAGFPGQPALYIHEATLLPPFATAGWARRLAMEEAAQALRSGGDLLLSSDADTVVSPDWVRRTLAYFDRGFDAVAGLAVVHHTEWQGLTAKQRARLRSLRKYQALLSYLRLYGAVDRDRWPRHDYEGGASIAVTLGMYRAIGGCPPLPVGEDRALFEAIRRKGGVIRHALDVKVSTSGRLVGRAPGGMADTVRRWCNQPPHVPLHDVWPITVALGHVAQAKSRPLLVGELPREIEKAQALARQLRDTKRLALSA